MKKLVLSVFLIVFATTISVRAQDTATVEATSSTEAEKCTEKCKGFEKILEMWDRSKPQNQNPATTAVKPEEKPLEKEIIKPAEVPLKKQKTVKKAVKKAKKPAEAVKTTEAAKPNDATKPAEAVKAEPQASTIVTSKPETQTPAEATKPSAKGPKTTEARHKRLEIGFITSGGVSVSSSPIADVEVGANEGKDIRFIGPLWKDFDFTLLYAEQSYDFLMGGVKLGEIESMVLSSTARFNPDFSRHFLPYIGVGIHYTKIDQALLAGDTLKLDSAGGIGPVFEYGVTLPIGRTGVHFDLNATQRFWSAEGLRLETNTGNALMSTVRISNPHWVGVSIGSSF